MATNLIIKPWFFIKMKNFKNMREFYNFMERITAEGRIFETATLKAMAGLVEHDAKRKFGEYQGAVGDYPAWAELKESTQQERVRLGYTPNDPLYRSGDLMSSIYSGVDMGAKVAAVGSDDPVMLYQEKGTPTIPPRAALGPALFQNKKKIQKIASDMMFAWLTNRPLKPEAK
jgi:hypothetical protein